MKHLWWLLSLCPCLLFAQGKKADFQTYLSHFKEVSADCSIHGDSLDLLFTEKVPEEVACRYISETPDSETCYYGIKKDVLNGVAVVLLRDIPDFPTKWGRGIKECWAMVYSPVGEKKCEMLLGTKSDAQTFRLFLSSLNKISVDEITLQDCFDRESRYYNAVKYSKGYRFDKDGMLRYYSQFRHSELKIEKKERLFNVLEEHEVWLDVWTNYVKATPIE